MIEYVECVETKRQIQAPQLTEWTPHLNQGDSKENGKTGSGHDGKWGSNHASLHSPPFGIQA